MKRILAIIIIINFLFISVFAQFKGKAGVYYLGAADIAISSKAINDSAISGIVVRFKWNSVEPTEGKYDWSFVDSEIAKAKQYSKKVSLQPLGNPDWLKLQGAKVYYYIDKNTFHPTYGQLLADILTWDSVYIDAFKAFLKQMSVKYAADTNITYINAIGGNLSRNMPDSVIIDTLKKTMTPFYKAFDYNADTLAALMNKITDYYMSIFPNTPLWCSVDYVRFEQMASKRATNYLATQYTSYGLKHYPDRFGLFREDISGCNPPNNVKSDNHWLIMNNNPCQTGAQMLWSVQDVPARMNKCNIVPNTKLAVLDSAIRHAITLGMRYLEIYSADISDAELRGVINDGNVELAKKAEACGKTIINSAIKKDNISINPNPCTEKLYVNSVSKVVGFKIIGILGGIMSYGFGDTKEINIVNLPKGVYILELNTSNGIVRTKFIKD